jgi:hydrogenase maturation protease
MMASVWIIGCGNPLRGDDGLGWHAAARLAGELDEQSSRVIACHQLTPELAEPIGRADLVIFIDAEQGQPAGQVRCRQIAASNGTGAFSHHMTPGNLLAAARELFGSSPEAILFSVGAERFDCSDRLSESVAAALPELIERVGELVARRLRATAKTSAAGGGRA